MISNSYPNQVLMEATDHAKDISASPFSPARSRPTTSHKPPSPPRKYSQPTQPYVYDSTNPPTCEANRKIHPPSNQMKQRAKFASVRQPMAPPCNQRRLNFHTDVSHEWRHATEVHLQRAVHDAKLANIRAKAKQKYPNPSPRSSRNINTAPHKKDQHQPANSVHHQNEIQQGAVHHLNDAEIIHDQNAVAANDSENQNTVQQYVQNTAQAHVAGVSGVVSNIIRTAAAGGSRAFKSGGSDVASSRGLRKRKNQKINNHE